MTHPDINGLVATCREKHGCYTAREIKFLRSIANTTCATLTSKQIEWLEALAQREPIDFAATNAAALAVLSAICRRWLPDGKMQGREYVACNPTRADGSPGSFRINIQTGRWADFAIQGASGGDPVSLAAFLFHDGDQVAAAIDLKRMVQL
jgi:hypothetical protein